MSAQEISEQQILVFKALFSRSLEGASFSLMHISFDEFCGALLNQPQFKNTIKENAYKLLVDKYGTNDLIPRGTHFTVSEHENTAKSRTNEDVLLSKFRLLNDNGQDKLIDYANDLVDNTRYLKISRKISPPIDISNLSNKTEMVGFAGTRQISFDESGNIASPHASGTSTSEKRKKKLPKF